MYKNEIQVVIIVQKKSYAISRKSVQPVEIAVIKDDLTHYQKYQSSSQIRGIFFSI